MDRNDDVITFFSKNLFFKKKKLRRPGIAILLTSSKLWSFLLEKSLKTQEKLEELEIVYLNGIYICISWYSKIRWFLVKKCWCQQNSSGVSLDSYSFFDLLRVSYNCAKFHHCRICVIDFRDGGLFAPPPLHPWASPKKPIFNSSKNYYLYNHVLSKEIRQNFIFIVDKRFYWEKSFSGLNSSTSCYSFAIK